MKIAKSMNGIGKPDREIIVPFLLAIAFLAASFVIFLLDMGSTAARLQRETQLAGSSFAARLEAHLNTRLEAGELLGQRFVGVNDVDFDAFRAETELLHDLFDDFQALSWVNSEGVIEIVTPEEGNEAARGLDLRQLPLPSAALTRAENSGNMQVTPPLELAQGGDGFTAYVPVRGDTGRKGFINIVFRSAPLIERVLAENSDLSFHYGVWDGDRSVFRSSGNATATELTYKHAVLVGDREWQLLVTPTDERVKQSESLIGEVVLGFGALSALLSGVTSHLVFRRNKAARESQARLRDIADNIHDIVWVNTPDFRETLYVNCAFEKLFGVSLAEIRQDPQAWRRGVVPEDAEIIAKTAAEFAARADGVENVGLESLVYPVYRVIGPDGDKRQIYARSVAIRDSTGEIERFVGVATDVTELLQAQHDLRVSNERLLQTQKMEAIGQLTGGVAHDFNNLLAVILGNIELIEDEPKSNDFRGYLAAAKSATHRGADLTKSLLSFAGQSRLNPTPTDLNELVYEVQTWSSRVLPETIEVEVSLFAGLWLTEVDQGLTQNALLNLFLNARDAMPNGGKIKVETSNLRIGDDYTLTCDENVELGRYVLLTVGDTGEGIPEEYLSQIFEPFFTTKPVGSGSGLGLSMVQGFMKQSGGTVRVHSERGSGTTFKLYFKATETAENATS